MESVFVDVIRRLSSDCLSGRKIDETTFLSTLALLCLKKEHGSTAHVLSLLKTSILKSLQDASAMLDANETTSSSPCTHPHADTHPHCNIKHFWSTLCHLVDLTTLSDPLRTYLDTFERFHFSCTTTLKVHLKIASYVLNDEQKLDFEKSLCGCVGQIGLRLKESSPNRCEHSLDAFVKVLTVCYILTELNDLSRFGLSETQVEGQASLDKRESTLRGEVSSSVLESLLVSLSSAAPRVVNRAYQESLEKENPEKDSYSSGSLESGIILKSVHTLTDFLLLLTTVAKGTQYLQPIVIETSFRLMNHCWKQLMQLYKAFPKELPLKSLYVVFSSSLHLHTVFEELQDQLDMQQQETSAHLAITLVEFCDELKGVIVSYHTQLCNTSLLHDTCSHDWTSSQPFFDGGRCSFSIQMWHYHMVGLKYDLRTLLPDRYGNVSRQIILDVLSGTLCFLAGRYSLVSPFYRRVQQIRGDILTILLTVSSFLSFKNTSSYSTHSSWSVIHASCSSLLQTMAITVSPLSDLKEYLTLCFSASDDVKSQQKSEPSTEFAEVWLSFLKNTNSVPDDTSLYGHSQTDHSDDISERELTREAKVSLPLHSYPLDTTSWPNLLQALLSNKAKLAVKLSRRDDFKSLIPHLVLVLSQCYQSPCALSHVYISGHQVNINPLDEGKLLAEDGNEFLHSAVQLITDALQEYVLLTATRFYGSDIQVQHNRDQHVWEDLGAIVNGLVEEVLTQLSLPLLELLRTLAGTEGGTLSLGEKMAKILGRVLGAWSVHLLPGLSEPLTSAVFTYTTVLKHSLMGTLQEQGHSDLDSLAPHLLRSLRQLSPALSDKLSKLEFNISSDEQEAAGQEAGWEEHVMVAELMEVDKNAVQSLRAIYTYLSSSPLTPSPLTHSSLTPSPLTPEFNPITVYASVGGEGGVTMATVMEKAENVDWKELLNMFPSSHMTRERVAMLVVKRWEFQEGNVSLLDESEIEQIQSIRSSIFYSSNDCSV